MKEVEGIQVKKKRGRKEDESRSQWNERCRDDEREDKIEREKE